MPGSGSIAIDGPAGSGKSTIGEQLAHRLGYLYIDTGAMYRALAWLSLQRGVDMQDAVELERLAKEADIVISHPTIDDGRQYTVTVNGQDITWEIRNPEVTRIVPISSSHPGVRAVMRARQREMAEHAAVVMVGRDIGSVVLPNAQRKIYLTASLQERARRRYAEMAERLGASNPALPTLQHIISDIQQRDDEDREKMRPASDAILVETDHLTIPQVLDVVYHYVEDLV